MATAAYRILQESITNTIRHVGPTRVTVGVEFSRDLVEISIADAGRRSADSRPVGNSPPRAEHGRGIRGMRERCELLGGRLEAGPVPGAGFQVRALLPLTPGKETAG